MTTSIINSDDGVVSGTSGLKTTGGNDGVLYIQNNGTTAVTVASTGDTTFAQDVAVTGSLSVAGSNISAANSMGFRNRIINGDMRIDQRNAGAAVTCNSTTATYCVDRFFGRSESTDGVYTLQQTTTAPANFVNSLKVTVTTADASIGSTQRYQVQHRIEGYNTADFGWGTANAKTVTLSFWVRSSLTGTFGGSFANSDATRSYPFTYTISSADTWEQKTVTVSGDTSGTWLTDSGIGVQIIFALGTGSTYLGTPGSWSGNFYTGATGQTQVISTNGATWYITGVQLEVGSVATEFERRPYGTEFMLCQRYYYKSYNQSTTPGSVTGNGSFSSTLFNTLGGSTGYVEQYGVPTSRVTMRTAPTVAYWDLVGNASKGSYYASGAFTNNQQLTVHTVSESAFAFYTDVATAKGGVAFQYTCSAEL